MNNREHPQNLTHPYNPKVTAIGFILLTVLVATLAVSTASAGLQNSDTEYVQTLPDTRAYQGPGDQYPLMAIYTQPITLTVTGRTEDSTWLQVDLSPYQSAWMKSDAVTNFSSETVIMVAPIPEGLVTSTPVSKPWVTLSLKALNASDLGSLGSKQVIGVYINSREPYTKMTVEIFASDNDRIWRWTGRTDKDGYVNVNYGSGFLTNGTYTVVVTDGAGNSVTEQLTLTNSKRPTPKPTKDK